MKRETKEERNTRAMLFKRKMNIEKPWYRHYRSSRNRCINKSSGNFKYYGGRGIKHLISIEEVAILWRRDGAVGMKQPELGRTENDGNYEFKNCKFIEHKENMQDRRPWKCKSTRAD